MITVSEFYTVEKSVVLVANIQGVDEKIKIEVLRGKDGMYSTHA